MERPRDIEFFAVTGVIACLANAGASMVMMDFSPRVLMSALLSVAIVVGLVLWVRLARSTIGRLVATIWLAFVTGAAIASYAILLVQHRAAVMSPVVHALSLFMIAANCLALYFLWREPSTAWLQKNADAS